MQSRCGNTVSAWCAPAAGARKAAVADGYLVAGDSIEQLAQRLNIDPVNLRATVDRMNDYARTGRDLEFGRGSTVYQNHNGDASAGGANPNLGPIATAPFYALRLYPSDIGTSAGLVTDELPRVLDSGNRPIARLYACGNDMQSIMGGTYPGPGITLGPAIAFAYARGVGRDHAVRIISASRSTARAPRNC